MRMDDTSTSGKVTVIGPIRRGDRTAGEVAADDDVADVHQRLPNAVGGPLGSNQDTAPVRRHVRAGDPHVEPRDARRFGQIALDVGAAAAQVDQDPPKKGSP